MADTNGLVPKQITDKNGKKTTVYIRDGAAKGGNASKLRSANVSAATGESSAESKIIDVPRDKHSVFEGKADPKTGAKPVALVRPDLSAEEGMVFAGLKKKDGTVITMMDEGAEFETEFSDGGSTKSFFFPVDKNFEPVDVTRGEFEQLDKLNDEFHAMEDDILEVEEDGDWSARDSGSWRMKNAAPFIASKMEEKGFKFSGYDEYEEF